MQLSRFVVTYRDVRPGEHVLYSVLTDRYVGIDETTIEAIARWSRGEVAGEASERETQAALLEEGFLVEGRDPLLSRHRHAECAQELLRLMLVDGPPARACAE